jgi:energy-coupling factor transporter ATP-binding protein EcfA2
VCVTIIKDGRTCWESGEVTSATQVDDKFKLKFKLPDSDSNTSKWENMGLDEHLKATVLAGLIKKYRDACNYLNDKPNPSQATRILFLRVKSRKEHLDLQTLINEDVPLCLASGEEKKKQKSGPSAAAVPTHVVVGVTYGAEAYCVLTQEVGEEADEDAREEAEEKLSEIAQKMEEAEEKLSEIAQKMEEALNEKQELNEFKEQFDDKKQLTRVKCRLYADLQSSAFRKCSVFDAYKNCLKLIDQVQKRKAVPIAVLLCPLTCLMGKIKGGYQDVDDDLIVRCGRIWDELERVGAKLDSIRTSIKKEFRPSLRQFEDALGKYKELLKKSWKNGVVKARENGDENEIEKAANIAETHPLFKPTRLERWLRYKQAESEMAGKMKGVSDITFFANRKSLEKELAESFDKRHALVLSVPPLDEKTNEILVDMKDYVDNYTKLTSVDDDDDNTDEDDEDDDKIPWHIIQRKQKPVLKKIRELADHVNKNKHLTDQVPFCITFGSGNGCRYSVYEDGNVLKDNLGRLPGPPTDLRIADVQENRKNKKLNVRLEWNYEDPGFPYSFMVEYQYDDSFIESWTQKKTAKLGENHLILNLTKQNGSTIKFRVAADTCIGRSEFSEIINDEMASANEDDASNTDRESVCSAREIPATRKSFQSNNHQMTTVQPPLEPTGVAKKENKKSDLQPPTDVEVVLVTQSRAEIGWKNSSVGSPWYSYRIRYWQNGQDASSAHELDIPSYKSSCQLEQLEPETTYFVNIVVVSDDLQEISAPSDEVSLTTLAEEVRFAETIVKRCKSIGNRNGMDLFAIPLIKVTGSLSTAERFAFGKADGRQGGASQQKGKMQHRTILVMGATGSGKTTLINGMINYIFNVQWEDTFRFQLIEEQTAGRSQVDSQTSRITAYDIHHAEGFNVPYSLTIVDTPGYGDTKGLDRDQEITEMVRKFFEDKDGIQELDVIGFVAQASLPRLTPTQIYIFDSVLSIFGNDVKENINFLLTFADSQVPPVLSAIAEANLPYPTDPDTGEPFHHKFNNSGFFCSSRESGNTVDKFNRFFWRMGMENFQKFFSVLTTMKTKSLSLTKQVLDERKRLEATVDGLQPLIKIDLSKMEEMRKTKQMITNSQAQIEANENVEFEVEVTVPQKVEIPAGQYLTNCNKCYITCHNPCAYKNDDDKVKCWAMDSAMPEATRSCRICPEKCIWNMHANQPYSWEYVKQKQATSSDAIKQKYETELKRKLTAEDLIKALQKDIDQNAKEVLDRVNTVSSCIQRLDEIALRPNPFSTPQYIDLIIDAEQHEKRLGFKERIESLKKLRHMAVITSRVRNNESLLTRNRHDDFAD